MVGRRPGAGPALVCPPIVVSWNHHRVLVELRIKGYDPEVADPSTRAYSQTLDLATAMVDGMRTDGFETLVAAQLNASLGGTATVFVDRSRICVGAPEGVMRLAWEEIHRECGSNHPLERAYAIDGRTGPLTVSDVVAESVWRRNPSHYLSDRDLDGATKQLAVPLSGLAGLNTGFLVCRAGRDFGHRERTLAAQVIPLLDAMFRHV